MKRRVIRAADLFCGGGGTSTGLVRACEALGFDVDLVAVNHWERAVETHRANHPGARHYCSRIDEVRLRDAFPRGTLDLLVASPECIFHSVARGGKPVDDQRRESAWGVIRWIDELRPAHVLIENVPEFRHWGPLGADGRPLKSKRGTIFAAWSAAIASLGYQVEWRLLNAADFGEATTRTRLFLQARRGRRQPGWPEPTHAEAAAGADLFDSRRRPWRPAREVIDFTLPSRSIFGRDRPLAETTLQRIAEGLRRFGGAAAEPFLLYLTHGARARSVDAPLPTVTAARELGVVQPYLVEFHGAKAGESPRVKSVDAPLPTLTCEPRFAVAQPFVVKTSHRGGNGAYVRAVEDPLYTVTTAQEEIGLAQPFVLAPLGIGRGNAPRSVEAPLPTALASRGGGHLVQPFLLSQASGGAPRAVSEPAPTLVSRGGGALVEPYLVPYHRTGSPVPLGEPMPTQTTRDRFGLVTPERVDILFRMLQPHELAAAMGFPAGYLFTGNRSDVVRQIGNAVCVNVAEALCRAALVESAA